MKYSKVILLSTVCLFGYTEDVYSAGYPALGISSLISTSGIHTYHTPHTFTDVSSLLPSAHPRGVAKSSPRLVPSAESAMLTSYQPQAQSAFSSAQGKEYKEASVCFITDTTDCSGSGKFSPNETPGDGENPDFENPQDICIKEGYNKHPCPAGSHGDNLCPLDSAYSKGCVCDDNMTEVCEPPYYGVGSSCGGKYARCERDDVRACREDGYNLSGSCPSLQTPNKRCPYNSSYYDKCVCRSDLVTCSSPLVGVGTSCGGRYSSCKCPSSYKSCECGGAVGASSCTADGVTRYSSCKACCTPKSNETGCQYGTYACDNGCGGSRLCCKVCDPEDRTCQCPGYVYCGDTKTGSGASCSAGDKTFYETCLVKETCLEGARDKGYVAQNWPEELLVQKGYCTTLTGKVLNLYMFCNGMNGRPEGVNAPCYNKKECPGNKGHQNNGSADPCICQNTKFFDKCDDSCTMDGLYANGGSCAAVPYEQTAGYYTVKEKCTTMNGIKIKYIASCDGIDCEGKSAPCRGKQHCTENTIAVDPCTCGGYTYGSSCVVKCPYEDTEYTCTIKGQSFTQRCKDNSGTWFGECK